MVTEVEKTEDFSRHGIAEHTVRAPRCLQFTLSVLQLRCYRSDIKCPCPHMVACRFSLASVRPRECYWLEFYRIRWINGLSWPLAELFILLIFARSAEFKALINGFRVELNVVDVCAAPMDHPANFK